MNWDISPIETKNYLDACKSFYENDELFLNFKKNADYRVILEHLNQQEGNFYFSRITDDYLLSDQSMINKLKENDLFGNPDGYVYGNYGYISPSTIRYISNLSDIRKHFDTDFDTIYEIGGGYGGLAKTINCVYDYSSYTLADQPEVNLLSEKYLGMFPKLDGKIKHINCFELKDEFELDLVISNYALSELSFESQKEYYSKVICNSNNFYIMYNHLTGNHYEDFYKLASEDFNIETELELHGNVIMYGKKK